VIRFGPSLRAFQSNGLGDSYAGALVSVRNSLRLPFVGRLCRSTMLLAILVSEKYRPDDRTSPADNASHVDNIWITFQEISANIKPSHILQTRL